MTGKIAVFILLMLAAQFLVGQSVPSVTISVKDSGGKEGELASTVKIALMLTLLALTPAILMIMTSLPGSLFPSTFCGKQWVCRGCRPTRWSSA